MRPSFSDINIIDTDPSHMLGRVHSVVSGSVVDGPGIRQVIFLQGCQFKCLYCHNRDTWNMDDGRLYTVSELVDDALSYVKFMDKSRGGVTVSGGEPLLQPDFLALLFEKFKQLDVHTCLDTNGYASRHLYDGKLDEILRNTDLVMLDIKQMDPVKHQSLTGIGNENVLKFARYLNDIKQATRVRYVVVPGYTDSEVDIRALAKFVGSLTNIRLIELLPYHKMGKNKWQEMGYNYPLEDVDAPSEQNVLKIKHLLENECQLPVLL